MWWPDRALSNRAQWLRNADYKSKVGMVMDVIAKRQDLLRALIRYVEAKLLIGGVTSGQGMVTKYGGRPLFRGLVRNFEQPDDPSLLAVRHKITDLKPTEIEAFRRALQSGARMLFHLAEGTDARAQAQFTLLADNGLLALNLVGIHSLGLTDADLDKLAATKGGVVWSPLSNTLLYGRTLDPAALARTGIRFALGSDWTPSGSRNILCEMKVASIIAAASGAPLQPRKLALAVTREAMKLAGWHEKLGIIAPGYYADLTIVAARQDADPYAHLLAATEADVRLVVVAGHARYGDTALMEAAVLDSARFERLQVGGRPKALDLHHPASLINGISLESARKMLAEALADLPAAREAAALQPLDNGPKIEIEFELHELEAELAAEGRDIVPLADAVLPKSVPLDPLTLIDDPAFWSLIDGIAHLPTSLKGGAGLRRYYSP